MAGGPRRLLGSPLRGRCFRVLVELPDGLDETQTECEAELLLARLPDSGAEVLLHGEGGSCRPAPRSAVRRGLSTRIGLEDVLELPDRSPAPDNAALIRAVRQLIELAPGGDPNRRVLRSVGGDS